jgi:DedD protein
MAEVAPADPQAEARTRARRTLIGSAILALTAVVVVPLVMDSKPRPWSDDVQLQIPGKDSKFDTPLPAPAVTPAPAASPVAPKAAITEVPKATPAATAAPEPKAASMPSPSSPKPTPEAKEEPKPSPAPAEKAPGAKAGKLVLQAGAFTTEERIKAVESELRKAGFTPYREEVPAKSGTVTRLRFTVASQEAADKAVAKLAAAGITPKVVSQ